MISLVIEEGKSQTSETPEFSPPFQRLELHCNPSALCYFPITPRFSKRVRDEHDPGLVPLIFQSKSQSRLLMRKC